MAQRIIQDLPCLMQARRTSLGMSMRDVAFALGLPPASRYVVPPEGVDVSLETAVRIIKWLAWSG